MPTFPLPRLVLFLCISLLCICTGLAQSSAKKPNLVLIIADDLGYGDLTCMGSSQIQTPAIDSLAKEGILCTRAYVTAPMCAPSRMGVLTGRFPKRYGITTNPNHQSAYLPEKVYGLPKSEILLPEILKKHGYTSAAFGKWHLGHTEGFTPVDRGFDEWWGFLGGSRHYFPHKPEQGGLNPSKITSNYTQETDVTYLTDDITRESVSFIKRRQEDGKPFFMYIAYNAPHSPLQAREEDMEPYLHVNNKQRRTYCGMVHALDRGVGKITEALKESKLDDNTFIVFLSDNGGAWPHIPACNAPLRGEKRLHFEGGVRVPFIVKYPAGKWAPGTKSTQVVSSLDIMPTFLSSAGIPLPENLDGENMLPCLKDPSLRKSRTLYWCTADTAAILKGDLKYLLVPTLPPQLFDIASDPTESHNLYKDSNGIQKSLPLARSLGEYLSGTPGMRYPDTVKWTSELLKHYEKASIHKQPK